MNGEEFDYSVKRIEQWYKKDTKTLSVITAPFNVSSIFYDVILEVIKSREKVLYVSDSDCKSIINDLKHIKKNITYSHIKSGESYYNIAFVNNSDIENITGSYELVIFDDISTFSVLSNEEIRDKYDILSRISNRIILYLSDEVINCGDKFDLVNLSDDKPYVEPRFITTRIDLNSDIPYLLYDYLKWFRDSKKNVIIYVPNEELVGDVYDYYLNKLKFNGVKLIPISEKTDKKIIKNVLKIKDKSTFIITDLVAESLKEWYIDNAVVLFADSSDYSGKELLYICGALGNINVNLPEVIFVSNDVSYSMDYSKEKSRDFNKMIWEKKLVKL